MANESREDLKNYVLRRLGSPLINIEVEAGQVEDRIQDALDFFSEFHIAGTEDVYLKHTITASVLACETITGTFLKDEEIEGNTSGASCKYFGAIDATGMKVYSPEGTFTVGETVTGKRSGATCVFESYTKGDFDNRYIEVADNIVSVIKLFPINDIANRRGGMFDVQYQFALESLNSISNLDLQGYVMFRRHLALLENLFSGERGVRFNRHTNRLHIDMTWRADYIEKIMIMQAWAIVDPNEHLRVYDNRFLKKYATALVKQQWGYNLKKHSGLQLPGGVTLNGKEIYDEATDELRQLETEEIKRYIRPARMMIG